MGVYATRIVGPLLYRSTADLHRRVEQHLNGQAYSTRRLGERLEVAATLEVNELATARQIEREMKKKKNPKLALFLLERYRAATPRLEQPRTLSGLVTGQILLGPPLKMAWTALVNLWIVSNSVRPIP
jgi:predicted GIY-YIG superfamily endonuclease